MAFWAAMPTLLVHVRSRAKSHTLARSAALCQAPCCLAGVQILETPQHAFHDCPEAAPVVEWLQETWLSLTGVKVPHTAQVVLADDVRAWPQAPSDANTTSDYIGGFQ